MTKHTWVGWILGTLILMAMVSPHADEPKTFIVSDGDFEGTLYIIEDKDMLNRIKESAHADALREMCPLCAFLADNSDDLIWLPFVVTWEEETDLSNYDPDVWVRTGRRWYKMRDMIMPLPEGGKMNYTRLGPVHTLVPDKYFGGPKPADADPKQATAMLAFKRSKRFDVKDIEEIQFTTDKEARPLKK
jgi:hypothetical protein